MSLSRYRPSRQYYLLLAFALLGGALSAWCGQRWPWAFLAAAGFGVSALGLLALILRPVVEIHESRLKIGRHAIPWRDIRRLDTTGWNAPLVVRLTLSAEKGTRTQKGTRTKLLIYPGDLASCSSLLRDLKRNSRQALLDGVPYPQAVGEVSTQPRQLPPGRYPVLRAEDEEEVERMFQRLKSEGTLERGIGDPHGLGDPRGTRGPLHGQPDKHEPDKHEPDKHHPDKQEHRPLGGTKQGPVSGRPRGSDEK